MCDFSFSLVRRTNLSCFCLIYFLPPGGTLDGQSQFTRRVTFGSASYNSGSSLVRCEPSILSCRPFRCPHFQPLARCDPSQWSVGKPFFIIRTYFFLLSFLLPFTHATKPFEKYVILSLPLGGQRLSIVINVRLWFFGSLLRVDGWQIKKYGHSNSIRKSD